MILVVMAAGMGSRFGGLKQLTPVGPHGEFLIDYSIYDAIKAGVKKIVFVIKEEHFSLFRDTIGKRIESIVKVEYAFQKKEDVPIEEAKKIQREKPWGTGQALLASRIYVDDSFMIINADDFYGRDAFKILADFLKQSTQKKEAKKHYALVTYMLKNTISPNGTVSRGICEVENGYLKQVTERTKIAYQEKKLVYYEEEKEIPLDEKSLVSVNLFGFTKEIFEDATTYFKEFLTTKEDLTKKEFYLPFIVQKSIENGVCDVKVLNTTSKFHGMTYQEDLEGVCNYIKELIKTGVYPENLWEGKHEK